MNDLLILGAGIHSAEMVEIVERINRRRKTWNLLGFVSRNPVDVGNKFNGKAVLGTFEKFPKFNKARTFFALSNHNKLPERLGVDPERWVSLVDPSAFISKTALLGRGSVVYPGCFVGLQAKLGTRVFMLANSVVNHDVVLGDRVIVTSGVMIAGGVHVGEGCYLGQSCTIRERLRIGRNSFIGMGAVVTKDVPSGWVVAGNPARKMRERKSGE